MLTTSLVDLAAFKAPFRLGGSIYDLTTSDVRNPDAAIANAEALATEIRDCLIAEQNKAEAKGVTAND